MCWITVLLLIFGITFASDGKSTTTTGGPAAAKPDCKALPCHKCIGKEGRCNEHDKDKCTKAGGHWCGEENPFTGKAGTDAKGRCESLPCKTCIGKEGVCKQKATKDKCPADKGAIWCPDAEAGKADDKGAAAPKAADKAAKPDAPTPKHNEEVEVADAFLDESFDCWTQGFVLGAISSSVLLTGIFHKMCSSRKHTDATKPLLV